MDKKKVLFVLQQDPLSGSLARAGVDTALAYAAFDQPVSVLFCGAGVLQLAPQADTMRAGRRDLRRVIDSMPLYDIEAIFVDRGALQTMDCMKICHHLPRYWMPIRCLRCMRATTTS